MSITTIFSQGRPAPPARSIDPDRWRPAPVTDEEWLPPIGAVTKILPPDRAHPKRRAVLRIGGALVHVPFSQRPDGIIELDLAGWPNERKWGARLKHGILLALTPSRQPLPWPQRMARASQPDRLAQAAAIAMPALALGLLVAQQKTPASARAKPSAAKPTRRMPYDIR